MAKKKLNLLIATMDGEKHKGYADMVIMRCITGDMGVLPEHEACSVILDVGVLRIINDGEERRMALFGGIAQVQRREERRVSNRGRSARRETEPGEAGGASPADERKIDCLTEISIIANDAQWPEDIDIAHVEAERERMNLLSQENKDDLEIQRDQVLMRRTLVQIEVSSYPLISKAERDGS